MSQDFEIDEFALGIAEWLLDLVAGSTRVRGRKSMAVAWAREALESLPTFPSSGSFGVEATREDIGASFGISPDELVVSASTGAGDWSFAAGPGWGSDEGLTWDVCELVSIRRPSYFEAIELEFSGLAFRNRLDVVVNRNQFVDRIAQLADCLGLSAGFREGDVLRLDSYGDMPLVTLKLAGHRAHFSMPLQRLDQGIVCVSAVELLQAVLMAKGELVRFSNDGHGLLVGGESGCLRLATRLADGFGQIEDDWLEDDGRWDLPELRSLLRVARLDKAAPDSVSIWVEHDTSMSHVRVTDCHNTVLGQSGETLDEYDRARTVPRRLVELMPSLPREIEVRSSDYHLVADLGDGLGFTFDLDGVDENYADEDYGNDEFD